MATGNNNGGSGWKPTIMMVAAQVMFSGMNILLKLAANDGMDNRVLVAYRFLFGAAFMVPIAFFMERKTRPKLTWKAFIYASLAGLFGGALGQNLYLESLVLTSATFISAMLNLMPAITFLVVVCLRLEKLGWNTAAGIAKVFGTLLGIGGAMLLTFYKGPQITIWETNVNLLDLTSHHGSHKSPSTSGSNLALGIVLSLLSCVSYSLWLIIQAQAALVYPAPLSFAAFMVLMSSIMGSVYALCMQRDWSQWRLGWNIRLLTVSYAVVFNPVVLVMVGLAGSLVLDEPIHLGNLLGGIIVICSLYVVLWGKSREDKKITQLVPEENAKSQDQEREKNEEKKSIHMDQGEHGQNVHDIDLHEIAIVPSTEK